MCVYMCVCLFVFCVCVSACMCVCIYVCVCLCVCCVCVFVCVCVSPSIEAFRVPMENDHMRIVHYSNITYFGIFQLKVCGSSAYKKGDEFGRKIPNDVKHCIFYQLE